MEEFADPELPDVGTFSPLTQLPFPYTYPPNMFWVRIYDLQLARRFAFPRDIFCMGNVQVGLFARKKAPSFSARCGLLWDLVVFSSTWDLVVLREMNRILRIKDSHFSATISLRGQQLLCRRHHLVAVATSSSPGERKKKL